MINKPIYPKIEETSSAIVEEGKTTYHTLIYSFLRKKHYGKWYLILHLNRATSLKNIEESKLFAHRDLAYNIYGSINFGKIDPKALDSFGTLRYPLDEFQGSELERFHSMYESWKK